MDLQTIFDNATKAARADALSQSNQLMLGELVLKLEAVSDKSLPIRFDWNERHITPLDSWRGIYAELAFGYTQDADEDGTLSTVDDVLRNAKAALGQTFTGYKGGDFTMGKNTPIWVANYGESNWEESGYLAVVNVEQQGKIVILRTERMES